MKRFPVALVSMLALLLTIAFAAPARADEAAEVSAVAVSDALNRTESPLAAAGNWTALNWAGGTLPAGRDTTSGWGPLDASPAVSGAYWFAQTSDAGGGNAAGLTLNVSPTAAGNYASVWLDMPSPGSAKSGYQLRWTLNAGLTTYTVKLSKWVAGSETVLASNASVSIPTGTRMMLSDNGSMLTAWKGTSSPLASLLTASDSTYGAGYAGIEASGNASRSTDFRSRSYSQTKILALPTRDDMQRTESPLSLAGKWVKTAAGENGGAAYSSGGRLGFGSPSGFASAYWSPEEFTDTGEGVAAAATVTTAASSGQWMAISINGSNLGNAATQNKYELRWTGTATANSYTLELAKVVANLRTVLISRTATISPGDTVALTQKQGSVMAWSGNPPVPMLIATDSTFSSGYAGISASGTSASADNFQAGPLTAQEPRVYWGARIGGGVYKAEEEAEGKEPKSWGDAPWEAATWNRFESHAGKEISVMHFGQPAPWTQAFAESPLKLTRERGAIPLISMDSTGATLKEIAEGKKDATLGTWAEKVAAYKYPFFLRWDWEMNASWPTWGKEAATSPTTYKEAWWHFHDLAEEKGASNITWVWCPSAGSGTSLSSLYPGKESEGKGSYVDWTCLDAYNKGTNPLGPESWKSFATLFRTGYNELIGLAPTKPIMIGEVASTEYGGSKSSWITDAYSTQMPRNFPHVKAVVWFNKNDSGRDWPIESSTSAQSAFAEAVASDFYAGNTFGSLPTLSRIKPLPWDYTPPAAPTVSSVSPASPANNNSPAVIGSAEAGSTVKLYTNNTCTSAVAATGSAAAFASPGLTVSVANNTTTTFYATATDAAGNTSSCSSTSVTYVEDSTAPAAPTVSSTSPASPANDNSPEVIGSAEAGSTVKLYTNNTCTSAIAATGTAAVFASPGLTVSFKDNETKTLWATATDAAGNVSACSTTSVTYKEVTPKVYWGARVSGQVFEEQETAEGKTPKKWGDVPWDAETWNRFESDAGGKKMSIAAFGQPAPWTQAFAESPLKLTRERGAYPLMTMDSWGATLKEIAEGKKDTSLKAWAEKVAAYKYPFFFRWDWEMNGNWFQWGEEAAASPTTYKEAWWHFHDLAEAAGATNLTWVWCPNAVFTGSTSLSSLYPGKESEGKGKYVDWTCVDGYNEGSSNWRSFSTVFSATYSELLELAPTKPIMIAETGSNETGGSKASWITDAYGTQIPSNFPSLKAVVWFNKRESASENWPIETSTTATSAFASAIAPGFYADNKFGSPTQLAPISPLP
jgi:beta-mannanase